MPWEPERRGGKNMEADWVGGVRRRLAELALMAVRVGGRLRNVVHRRITCVKGLYTGVKDFYTCV